MIVARSLPDGKYKITIVERGGPGSGHHGHVGREGEVGGSAPAGTPPPTEPVDSAQMTMGVEGEGVSSEPEENQGRQWLDLVSQQMEQQIEEAADQKIANAELHEPAITEMLQAIADETGARFDGLDYRLKSKKSLMRKIRSDIEEKGIPPQEAADQISDAVRYTYIFDPDDFVERVQSVQQSLAQSGWTQYDHKWKNFFKPGDAYDGYNTVLVNEETGMRFELQFHTPESIEIKKRAHRYYEEFRDLPESDPKRGELWDLMLNEWKDYTRPEGWETLPGVMK